MAQFESTVLTDKGRNLLAKAVAGISLKFTKVQIGSGLNTEPVETRTDLISPKITATELKVDFVGSGGCNIQSKFSNIGLTESFKLTEIGVFAHDPDVGEILYCYTYVTDEDKSDYFAADSELGIIEEIIIIGAYIGNASHVIVEFSRDEFVEIKDSLGESEDDVGHGYTKISNTIFGALNKIGFWIDSFKNELFPWIKDTLGNRNDDKGTSPTSSLFSWVKQISADLTDTKTAVGGSDSKLNELSLWIKDTLGNRNDSKGNSTTSSLFSWVKQIFSDLTDTKTTVGGLSSKLNEIKSEIIEVNTNVINSTPSVVKSIQRGNINTYNTDVGNHSGSDFYYELKVPISKVNPDKCIVILDFDFLGYTNVASFAPTLVSIDADGFTVTRATSYPLRACYFSWQVVEFY